MNPPISTPISSQTDEILMMQSPDRLCAVLLGLSENPQAAADHARNSIRCPYVAHYSAEGCLTVGVYVLPENKRWWIEIPAQRPELLGLVRASLAFMDFPDVESAWSRGDTRPELVQPPCGSDCEHCPQYQLRCAGCPASQFFRA